MLKIYLGEVQVSVCQRPPCQDGQLEGIILNNNLNTVAISEAWQNEEKISRVQLLQDINSIDKTGKEVLGAKLYCLSNRV